MIKVKRLFTRIIKGIKTYKGRRYNKKCIKMTYKKQIKKKPYEKKTYQKRRLEKKIYEKSLMKREDL